MLWGTRGVVHRMFEPIALWQAQCAGTVSGLALDSGHFVPEEAHAGVAAAVLSHFG